jgi:hypothetical protein
VGPRREAAAGDAFDRHAQIAVVRARTDRVRAPQFLTARFRPQREILAVREAEAVAEIGRDGERDDDRVARFAPDRRDGQGIETARRFSDT